MPTQEERLTTVERNATSFQREQARQNRKTDEDLTMLLGLVHIQRTETKQVLARLDTIERLFDGVDSRFDRVESHLEVLQRDMENVTQDMQGMKQDIHSVDSRLGTLENNMQEVKTLLTQLVKNSQNPS